MELSLHTISSAFPQVPLGQHSFQKLMSALLVRQGLKTLSNAGEVMSQKLCPVGSGHFRLLTSSQTGCLVRRGWMLPSVYILIALPVIAWECSTSSTGFALRVISSALIPLSSSAAKPHFQDLLPNLWSDGAGSHCPQWEGLWFGSLGMGKLSSKANKAPSLRIYTPTEFPGDYKPLTWLCR